MNLLKQLANKTSLFQNRIELFKIFTNTRMKLQFDSSLKGMKELNRDLFKLKLDVPMIKIKKNDYIRIRKLFKKYTLDSLNLKRYQNLNEQDPLNSTHKYIILDPELFDFEKMDETIKQEFLSILKQDKNFDISEPKNSVESLPIELSYEDLKFEDVMKAIIPENLLNENVNVKGYSIIGHIAHFNLRDKVLEYKNIIGL